MVRSLGLVMLIVVPIWFLAQPPDSDEQAIRVVDPSDRHRAAAGRPRPACRCRARCRRAGGRPARRSTRRTCGSAWSRRRASTPSTRPPTRPEFLAEVTGRRRPRSARCRSGGQTWRLFDDGDEHTTLVRERRRPHGRGRRACARRPRSRELAGARRRDALGLALAPGPRRAGPARRRATAGRPPRAPRRAPTAPATPPAWRRPASSRRTTSTSSSRAASYDGAAGRLGHAPDPTCGWRAARRPPPGSAAAR